MKDAYVESLRILHSPSVRCLMRGSMSPPSAICLIFVGDFSKFLKVSSAFSEANSSDLLSFMMISIGIPPVTEPIGSDNDWDLESSNNRSKALSRMDL